MYTSSALTATPAKANPISRPTGIGWVVRSFGLLGMLAYLLITPMPDSIGILSCASVVVTCVVHAAVSDLRNGVRELLSLHNAVLLGLVAYAVPILVLFTLVEIPIVLDMAQTSLQRAARVTYISLAVAGLVAELLRGWASSLHRYCLRRIAVNRTRRQYYILALLVAVYAANFLQGDVLSLLGSGNRFELTQAFESGKMWLVQYLVTGASVAFIYEHVGRRIARNAGYYLGLVSVVAFWLMYLSLGNRRGLITVILAAAICFIARKRQANRVIAILLLTFVAGGAIGVLRQDSSVSVDAESALIGLTNFLGEFIYPGYTLVQTMEQNRPPTFEFTWISMLYQLVAAQLSGAPFAFLAHQFAIDTAPQGSDTVMGFAYLPITEAYKNFGTTGAAVSGAAMLVSVVALASAFRRWAWVYLLLFSLTLDMNRSEFAAMVIQFAIVAIGFQLTRRPRL